MNIFRSNKPIKSDKCTYLVQNVNSNSLSKKYVSNIEESILIQKEIIKKVFNAKPDYENEWYKYSMNIDAF